jgi:hypothetical protein
MLEIRDLSARVLRLSLRVIVKLGASNLYSTSRKDVADFFIHSERITIGTRASDLYHSAKTHVLDHVIPASIWRHFLIYSFTLLALGVPNDASNSSVF